MSAGTKVLKVPGTRAHRIHSKKAIARKFQPGRRCWYFYWRMDLKFMILEIERRGAKDGSSS